MSAWLQVILVLVGAYLLGAVPFGFLIARARGVDIRKHGSGNVGATNVGRVLGRKWGLMVLLLDIAKGAAATAAVGILAIEGVTTDSMSRELLWMAAGACCVIGNVAPVYLRFRGGKGVATSLGALLGIYPYLTLPALSVLVVFGAVVLVTGYVSLGSILAAGLLPLVFVILCGVMGWGLDEHYPLLALCFVLAVLVMVRHRENISRLLSGTENRMGRPVERPENDA